MRVVLAADSCGQATSRVLTPSTSGGSHPPCPVGTSCPLRGPLTGHCPRPSSPAGSPPCLYSRRVSGSLANTAPNNAGPGAQASREPRSHPEQGALCRARRRVRPLPTARGQTARSANASGAEPSGRAGAGRSREAGGGTDAGTHLQQQPACRGEGHRAPPGRQSPPPDHISAKAGTEGSGRGGGRREGGGVARAMNPAFLRR